MPDKTVRSASDEFVILEDTRFPCEHSPESAVATGPQESAKYNDAQGGYSGRRKLSGWVDTLGGGWIDRMAEKDTKSVPSRPEGIDFQCHMGNDEVTKN